MSTFLAACVKADTPRVVAFQRYFQGPLINPWCKLVSELGAGVSFVFGSFFIVAALRPSSLLEFVCLYGFLMPLCNLTKDIMCLPRPPSPPVIHVEKKYLREYGFPSAHTGIVIGMWPNLALVVLQWLCFGSHNVGLNVACDAIGPSALAGASFLLTIFCVCAALTRVSMGVHSFTDLAGGAAFGVTTLLLGLIFANPTAPFPADANDLVPWLASLAGTRVPMPYSSAVPFTHVSVWWPVMQLLVMFFLWPCPPQRFTPALTDAATVVGINVGVCWAVPLVHGLFGDLSTVAEPSLLLSLSAGMAAFALTAGPAYAVMMLLFKPGVRILLGEGGLAVVPAKALMSHYTAGGSAWLTRYEVTKPTTAGGRGTTTSYLETCVYEVAVGIMVGVSLMLASFGARHFI